MAATQGENPRRLAVVTGGLGGLGSAICRTLADKGRKVVAVDLGSAPERIDAFNAAMAGTDAEFHALDVTDFDACGKKAIKDLAEANTNGSLFGSMAHGHANPASVKNAIYDVVTRAFNGELNSDEAVTELAAAVEGAK